QALVPVSGGGWFNTSCVKRLSPSEKRQFCPLPLNIYSAALSQPKAGEKARHVRCPACRVSASPPSPPLETTVAGSCHPFPHRPPPAVCWPFRLFLPPTSSFC